MKTMLTAFLSLGLVALLTSPAAAQGRGRGMGTLASLLGNESVQQELKLDDKQVEKAKELAEKASEEMREKFQGLQDLEPDERRAKFAEIAREANASTLKAAGEILKPEQIARLKEISHQVRGAQAFADPEVAKKLNLTEDQKKEIQTINTESMEERRSIFQDTQDQDERRQKMTELNKKTLEKVVAKLNDEQQKTWKGLLGSPFEIKYPSN